MNKVLWYLQSKALVRKNETDMIQRPVIHIYNKLKPECSIGHFHILCNRMVDDGWIIWDEYSDPKLVGKSDFLKIEDKGLKKLNKKVYSFWIDVWKIVKWLLGVGIIGFIGRLLLSK